MSGNISEWTTETATNSTGKCTYIGGGIGQQQGTAFSRYVSDTVSKDAGLTELVHFLSLEAPLEEWRDTVLNYKDYRKVSVKKQLADKGYSLDVMKQKVREIINS